ncbi:hypothetical protein EVAR_33398_1 [Eumeta japonica]|uniref:Uncharacterized protein n=1 Tax=Eumeta variegata TaxID=151549 RepID=A0A4C1W1M9_EUMVA|nr:hypothetical protein EVAR_33398_1 [Eumeta japonica]
MGSLKSDATPYLRYFAGITHGAHLKYEVSFTVLGPLMEFSCTAPPLEEAIDLTKRQRLHRNDISLSAINCMGRAYLSSLWTREGYRDNGCAERAGGGGRRAGAPRAPDNVSVRGDICAQLLPTYCSYLYGFTIFIVIPSASAAVRLFWPEVLFFAILPPTTILIQIGGLVLEFSSLAWCGLQLELAAACPRAAATPSSPLLAGAVRPRHKTRYKPPRHRRRPHRRRRARRYISANLLKSTFPTNTNTVTKSRIAAVWARGAGGGRRAAGGGCAASPETLSDLCPAGRYFIRRAPQENYKFPVSQPGE